MAASCFVNTTRKWDFLFKILLLFLFASVQVSARGKKTYNMIYQHIRFHSACIRRMNATHQIGCSSDFNGNTGVLHVIENDSDIDWLRDTGPHAPYIAFFSAGMFNRENLERLIATKKISGVVVDHSNETRRSYIDSSQNYSPIGPAQMITLLPKQRGTVTHTHTGPVFTTGNLPWAIIYGLLTIIVRVFNSLYHGTEYEGCSSVEWNRWGDGSNFEVDFGVPILALTHEDEVDAIIQLYEAHNQPNDSTPATYPLFAMELQDFMHGVKDTPTCMWRTQRTTNLELSSYCDPIGDKNVWGFAKNSNDTESSSYKSVIVAASPLDATSLFYNVHPRAGSESPVTSFVTLLSAAEAIGRLPKDEKAAWEHDIMFVLFNAESYDYTGSSRMVYDIERGYFPTSAERIDEDETDTKRLPQMNVTDISYFLELRQLGLSDGTYYAHVDPISQKDQKTKDMTDEMINVLEATAAVDVKISTVPDTPLPPASFQQFLKTGINIPGVVLTDHQKEYENRFYNSRYDIPESVLVDNQMEIDDLAVKLNKVSETVAKALVSLAGGNESLVTTNETMVKGMLDCFLFNASCTLFQSLNSKPNTKMSPIGVDLYPGVWHVDTPAGKVATKLLAYLLGDKTDMKEEDQEMECSRPDDNEIYNYLYVIGPNMKSDEGICVKSTVRTTPAVSPAFINDKDTKPDWASTKYPTWTESQWSTDPFSIRVFLVPSPQQEWVIFSLGLAIVLVSFPSVYFINARADVLFKTDSSY